MSNNLKNELKNGLQDELKNVFLKRQSIRQAQEGEYLNENDNLIYCTNCNTPRQKRIEIPLSSGLCTVPVLCDCRAKENEEYRKNEELKEHNRIAEQLRNSGIQDRKMLEWTFENADTSTPSMVIAKKYVEKFDEIEKENIGLLLWGDVGTGKSYLAGCIANALIDKEVSVKMTNFGIILADMTNLKTDKALYIKEINKYKLLIIDDFGMERDTAFALEQVYNVIDSRYTTSKPLIVTTNLMLDEMKNTAVHTDYRRIYDRILEMCTPIRFEGESRRKGNSDRKMNILRDILG